MSDWILKLVGLILELLGYGAYIMMLLDCINVLRKKKTHNIYLTPTTVALFLCITIHLIMDIDRAIEAFTAKPSIPNSADIFYGNITTVKSMIKTSCYLAGTLVSDAFIVYRCFIVWGKSYLVTALPLLLFLADVAMGILVTWTSSRVDPMAGTEDIFSQQMASRVPAFYSLTLCLNVICTTLIASKIWRIQSSVSPYLTTSKSSFSRVLTVVIESCAIYSALLFILIGTYAGNSPVMTIFLDSISPIIGIVFSSVIVRVGMGISHGDSISEDITTLRFKRAAQRKTTTGSDIPSVFATEVQLQQTVTQSSSAVDGSLKAKASLSNV